MHSNVLAKYAFKMLSKMLKCTIQMNPQYLILGVH